MARPSIRTEDIINEILERVSTGETLTSICQDFHMPTLRALLKWCVRDNVLDDRMHRARIRGTLIQRGRLLMAVLPKMTRNGYRQL